MMAVVHGVLSNAPLQYSFYCSTWAGQMLFRNGGSAQTYKSNNCQPPSTFTLNFTLQVELLVANKNSSPVNRYVVKTM